jgi:hypothetical protein
LYRDPSHQGWIRVGDRDLSEFEETFMDGGVIAAILATGSKAGYHCMLKEWQLIYYKY